MGGHVTATAGRLLDDDADLLRWPLRSHATGMSDDDLLAKLG